MILIDILLKIVWFIFPVVLILWYAYGFFLIWKKEKEILDVKSKIDNLENDDTSKRTLHSGMVNQSQFEKMTEKRRKPLTDKFETLKLERQFILDKLPLMGFFKK